MNGKLRVLALAASVTLMLGISTSCAGKAAVTASSKTQTSGASSAVSKAASNAGAAESAASVQSTAASAAVSKASQPAASKPADEVRNLNKRVITYYTWWAEPAKGSTQQANLYWKMKEQVEKDYNCTFKFQMMTGDWFATLSKSIMAGNPNADVFTAPLTNLYPAISSGLLMDLSTLKEFDFTDSKWHTPTMDKGKVGGKTYAMLASNGEMHNVVLYNKKIFASYSEPDLYTLYSQNQLTLDKFIGIAQDIKSKAGASIDVIAPYTYTFNFFNLMANAYGAALVTRDPNTLNFTCKINSNDVVNAYQQAQGLARDKVLMDTSGKDWKYAYNQFTSGKAAIYIAGSDMAGVFADAKGFEVGACLFPKKNGGYIIDQSDAIWCGIPKGVSKPNDVALVFNKMINVIFTTNYKVRYQDYLTADAMKVLDTISVESQKGNYLCDYFPMIDVWKTPSGNGTVGDDLVNKAQGLPTSATPAQTIQKIEPAIKAQLASETKGS